MGRNDQLDYLRERFAELGHVEPDESDMVLERVYGGPTERTLADYPTRRKELLLAMLDSHADRLDNARGGDRHLLRPPTPGRDPRLRRRKSQ